jgi:hypothetical protein
MNMVKLTRVRALADFRLALEFDDGLVGEVELGPRLVGPALERLRDPLEFGAVRLDEFGAPSWPCGVDWAPDALHADLKLALASAAPASPTR